MDGMFVYNPAMLPDYVQSISTASAQLEDVRGQAQSVLAHVRSVFDSRGGGAFEQAQMMINSGIDAGKEVIMRHSQVVGNANDDMIATDAAAAQSFGL